MWVVNKPDHLRKIEIIFSDNKTFESSDFCFTVFHYLDLKISLYFLYAIWVRSEVIFLTILYFQVVSREFYKILIIKSFVCQKITSGMKAFYENS